MTSRVKTVRWKRFGLMGAALATLFLMLFSALVVYAQPWPQLGGRLYEGDATWNSSRYWIAAHGPGSWFTNDQPADLELSGFGFNNASGPLVFNHPSSIATDGMHLLLADTYDNRILVWNSLPTGNVAPNIVLGQKTFTGDNSGNGLDQLNWPVAVATDGKHIVVADTYNNRILIWNSFPTSNGQPADVVLYPQFTVKGSSYAWQLYHPWGVWTNGTKLVVSSVAGGPNGGFVLIWNSFPTQNNQPASLYLASQGIGTPRWITSNGQEVLVDDENAKGPNEGTWVWKNFPTVNNTSPDFLMTNGAPAGMIDSNGGQSFRLWGTFLPDGRLVAIGFNLRMFIWNHAPQNATDVASQYVGTGCALYYIGLYRFCTGDPPGSVAYAGGRLYVSLGVGDKIVVFNSIPTQPAQPPDFAIGASSPYEDTERVHSAIENPMVVTDGKGLYVGGGIAGGSSMFVWKNLPDQSGATPDLFYDNPACDSNSTPWCFYQTQPFTPNSGASFGGALAFAGSTSTSKVWLWNNNSALAGQNPNVVFSGRIGNATFVNLGGVAIDGSHFYLADAGANKIYVWNGIPGPNTNPALALGITGPGQMSSDGNHLAVALGFQHEIAVYDISTLARGAQPTMISLSAGFGNKFPNVAAFGDAAAVCICDGHLFVTDTTNNRVLAWQSAQNAIDGQPPDTVLGQPDFLSVGPGTGPDNLISPQFMAWDGSHLWIGEFKFDLLLLRFSPSPLAGNQTLSLSVDSNPFSLRANTNDAVSAVAFNPQLKALRFVAKADSTGSTNLLFPNRLLNGSLTTTLDGSQTSAVVSSYNSTYADVKVSYGAGQHLVQIVGTKAVISKAPSDLSISVTNPNINPATGSTPFDAATLATSSPLNITGMLTPSLSTGHLTLEYRLGPLNPDYTAQFGPWTTIVTAPPTGGVLSNVWAPPRNGTYVFQAVWGGDGTHEASRSSTFILQVQSGPTSTTTTTTTSISTTSTTASSSTSTTTITSMVSTSSTTTASTSTSSTSSSPTSTTTATSTTTSTATPVPEFPNVDLTFLLSIFIVAVTFVFVRLRGRARG